MEWFNTKRKFKNIKLTKDFQIKYYGWWFVVSVVLIGILAVCLWTLFEENWLGILGEDPSMTINYIFSRSRYVPMLVFASLLLLIATTGLGIMTTHRIAGPLIKLQKAFDEVKGGNLKYRLQFRKQDELAELEKSFNEMMDSLRGKNARG